MPSTVIRSSTPARLTALAVPKWRSRARLRDGPMPAISSSGLRVHLLGAPRAVRADGEAVRLVAQALDEIEHRVAVRQHERLAAGHEEFLAAGVAVAALGDGRRAAGPRCRARQAPRRGGELALAAVDEDQVGPGRHRLAVLAPRRFGARPGLACSSRREAAAQHLAHHAEVVARRDVLGADVELAVVALR